MRRSKEAIGWKPDDLTIIIDGYARRRVADALYAECARIEAEATEKRRVGMANMMRLWADELRAIADKIVV